MPLSRRIPALLALLGASVLALAAGSPDAEARSYRTIASFGFYATPDAFLGDVDSGHPKCENRRLVKVYRKRRHGRRAKLVGRDRATSTGQWLVEKEVPRGRYFLKVPRQRFNRGRIVCRSYRSSTMPAG